MLTAAGVELPTNWDELTAAAEALTKDGVTGLCVGPEMPRCRRVHLPGRRRHLQRRT